MTRTDVIVVLLLFYEQVVAEPITCYSYNIHNGDDDIKIISAIINGIWRGGDVQTKCIVIGGGGLFSRIV